MKLGLGIGVVEPVHVSPLQHLLMVNAIRELVERG